VDGGPDGIKRAKMVVVMTPSEGKPSMGKVSENLAQVTRIGPDLAKATRTRCALGLGRCLELKGGRAGFRLTAVALANQPARIVVAILRSGEVYDDRPVAA
jgi:hypothetical protein